MYRGMDMREREKKKIPGEILRTKKNRENNE
jgi:hypothetical protein